MREWMRGPVWSSEGAEILWSRRVKRAAKAWEAIERESVAAAIRPGALQLYRPEQMPGLQGWAASRGLQITILDYASPGPAGQGTGGSGPAMLRVAIHKGFEHDWIRAWLSKQDDYIGQLLGFPECCRAHFDATWGKGFRSPEQAQDGAPGPSETNLMLRWLGVRLVPHLPCSHTCAPSIEIGRSLMALGARIGLATDTARLHEILSWPLTYTANHGAGEVLAPPFKFEFGDEYTKAKIKVFKPGVSPVLHPAPVAWDNGFTKASEMLAAHDAIIEGVRRLGLPIVNAVDLGAGDGTLLARLQDEGLIHKGLAVEANPDRVKRGKRLYPGVDFAVSQIRDFSGPKFPGLALISKQRLREDPEFPLKDVCDRWLVYDYDTEDGKITTEGVSYALEPSQTEARRIGY